MSLFKQFNVHLSLNRKLFNKGQECGSAPVLHILLLTSAVLGSDGVAIEIRGTPLTVGASRVSPAVLAVACNVVTFIEDQVGVRVAVTVTPLAGTTNHHWISIVTWGTPASRRTLFF